MKLLALVVGFSYALLSAAVASDFICYLSTRYVWWLVAMGGA